MFDLGLGMPNKQEIEKMISQVVAAILTTAADKRSMDEVVETYITILDKINPQPHQINSEEAMALMKRYLEMKEKEGDKEC